MLKNGHFLTSLLMKHSCIKIIYMYNSGTRLIHFLITYLIKDRLKRSV